MSKAMQIEWPKYDTKITAILEDERNPELCDEVWQSLPMDAVQEHGVVTGKLIYCWVPMISIAPVHFAENHSDAPVGRIFFSQATGNKIIVNYGACSEDLKAPVLGQVVPEDLAKLQAIGIKMWEMEYFTKEIIIVKFSQKEG